MLELLKPYIFEPTWIAFSVLLGTALGSLSKGQPNHTNKDGEDAKCRFCKIALAEQTQQSNTPGKRNQDGSRPSGLEVDGDILEKVHMSSNVRAKRATTAGRRARAGENVPRTTRPGLVACRWRSA